jgi:hypothetical protein
MLSGWRADRLARQAERARGFPGREWRGRRAWRILVAAGDQGDEAAIEAVWRSWCRVPDDARWELLTRWRDEERLARARALFYLLSGQDAQRRAADPDGALVVSAYAASDDQTRRLARDALSRAGDLALLRVIAGTGMAARQRVPLSREDRDFLASEFASRRDWDGLWQVVRGMPVPDALEWMPRFRAAWRPSPGRERVLFDVLHRADSQQVAVGIEALRPRSARIAVDSYGQVPAAVSGDGRRFAMVQPASGERDAAGGVQVVTEWDADTGEVSAEYRISWGRQASAGLFYAGSSLMAYEKQLNRPSVNPATALIRLAEGRPVPLPGELYPLQGKRLAVGPTTRPPGGFALSVSPYRYSSGDGGHLITLENDGTVAGTADIAAQDVPREFVSGPDGLLALVHESSFVREPGFSVYDMTDLARPRLAGRWRMPTRHPFLLLHHVHSVCLPLPGHVVALAGEQLYALRADQSGLEPVASSAPLDVYQLHQVAPVYGSEAIVVAGINGNTFRDARTLRRVPRPEWVPEGSTDRLWRSADGRCWAFPGYPPRPRHAPRLPYGLPDSVVVVCGQHQVLPIARCPPAEWLPGDLATVMSAVSDPGLHPQARPLAELLHACLAWRLDAEVRIGSLTSAPVPSADDVALSPERSPQQN